MDEKKFHQKYLMIIDECMNIQKYFIKLFSSQKYLMIIDECMNIQKYFINFFPLRNI